MKTAKDAAKAVVDTLTWVDFVNVMGFSSDTRLANERFVPATDENKYRKIIIIIAQKDA